MWEEETADVGASLTNSADEGGIDNGVVSALGVCDLTDLDRETNLSGWEITGRRSWRWEIDICLAMEMVAALATYVSESFAG